MKSELQDLLIIDGHISSFMLELYRFPLYATTQQAHSFRHTIRHVLLISAKFWHPLDSFGKKMVAGRQLKLKNLPHRLPVKIIDLTPASDAGPICKF